MPLYRRAVIGLGASLSNPDVCFAARALRCAIRSLQDQQCELQTVSSLYRTEPVGGGRQPDFLNAVVVIKTSLPPARLLRLCKSLERTAGRRLGRPNGPRPLDLDILDYAGQVTGNAASIRRPKLVLPHPLLHLRLFALIPLLEIAPHWWHSRLGTTGRRLLAKLPRRPSAIQRVLDPVWISCDQEV